MELRLKQMWQEMYLVFLNISVKANESDRSFLVCEIKICEGVSFLRLRAQKNIWIFFVMEMIWAGLSCFYIFLAKGLFGVA